MDWLLSGLVVISNFLVGRKNKWGWVIGIVSSALWIIYALLMLHPPQYGLVPSAFLNLVISATSAYKWFTEDIKNTRNIIQEKNHVG